MAYNNQGDQEQPLRKSLAEKGSEHAYQAHKFTKTKQEEVITSLKTQEGNLTSDIKEKASLLFYGTLIVETAANLDDIPHWQQPILSSDFPQVTEDEVANAIAELPNKKASGQYRIPNELIKLSKLLLTPILTKLYNLCLSREGTRKNGKNLKSDHWKSSQRQLH
ncbi:hypothetical protein O181_060281 [Austropuccinia psidii MF-1]|uniref:Reverse transcriptase domain-containing protein n=1 Tax=Austropuccinia psidii MF-1 TaxID=1389203 RepID=A0A9Q3EKM5_9BASI|nr:hypothetical protein [Austropuccinia psidii MF-1]